MTLGLIGLMILNSLLFTKNNTGALILSIDFFILLILLFSQRNEINPKLAKNTYIWVNILTTSTLMWTTGSSHYATVFPIFILIASLMVYSRMFIIISLYCISSIVLFGIIKVNSDLYHLEFGYWQMIDLIIILFSGIYTAWRTSNDMRYAVANLGEEVEKVTNSNNKIKGLINFDALTGLANSSYCKKQYEKLVANSPEDNEKVAIFFLDIDNFKAVNDFYDHSIGDMLLMHIAKRLNGLITEKDIACRLGGDEFILILSRPKEYDFQNFANNILECLSKPFKINLTLIDTTVSIGVAIVDGPAQKFNEIRKNADLAMYKAKQSGKNKFCVFNDEMYQQSLHKITIVNGLKDALKNDDLEVYLQPKVNITTGKINSAEALLRWTRNNEKNISPAEFIPLIESTELICDIGEWVIHHACRLCKEWHDKGHKDMSIAVNISSSQFLRGGLGKIVKRELEASKLAPKFLELELTEHAIFHDDDRIQKELKSLKDLGVILSIDDFGTGYSNIEYLTKFNVDIVKIDQSFIKDLQSSTENFAIVKAIIRMATTLDLKVVAEGVETKKEWNILKELGCHYGQGFLWSKALSPKNFTTYLKKDLRTTG